MPTASLVLLVAALAWVCWSDHLRLEIPDSASVALAAWFAVAAVATGMPWTTTAAHLGTAVVVFVVGALLFFFGIWGGGDVKLAAALALWFGPSAVPIWLAATAMCGGVLALAALLLRRLPAQRRDRLPRILAVLATPGEGIPYGVALAAAAMIQHGRAAALLGPPAP